MFGFGRKWIKTEGTVLATRVVSAGPNNTAVVLEFVVEVHPEGGPAFKAKVGQPYISTNFWKPDVGEAVGVEYDDKSKRVRFDKSDPRLSARARLAAAKARFDAKLEP